MTYHVKLEAFEGPLDLLLHLISKSKVKIEDVSITDITQQYLEYLEEMQRFDIEIASEFLVMAATLLHIKSCMLLPKVEPELEEDTEQLQQELIQRLLEYKQYKEAGQKLQEREKVYSNVYYKLPEEIVEAVKETSLFTGVTMEDLKQVFSKLMSEKRFVKKAPMVHHIHRDPVSIKQRIEELRRIFEYCEQTSFFQLFDGCCQRSDLVVTFLALLELLKENLVELYQETLFGDIQIRKRKLKHG